MTPDMRSVDRRLRFLLARGIDAQGADVLLSAFRLDEGDVGLMSGTAAAVVSTSTGP
jgi:hypothetical protein